MLLKAVTAGLVGALATLIVCAVFPAIHAGIGLWTTVGAGSLLSFVIEILTAVARKVTDRRLDVKVTEKDDEVWRQ